MTTPPERPPFHGQSYGHEPDAPYTYGGYGRHAYGGTRTGTPPGSGASGPAPQPPHAPEALGRTHPHASVAPHQPPYVRATFAPEPDTPRPAAPRTRDRYLDLLRTLALLRVVVYHTFGWAWLTLIFPSMGVMFALAGSLMARSLKRPAAQVLRSRMRRLLLPLWLYGVFVLTALHVQGWRPPKGDTGEQAWFWLRLACWVVPLGSPSFPWEIGDEGGLLEQSWAVEAAGPLWYLRAYLWFVLLSPLLLRAFRRLPWATLLAPLGLTAVVGTGLVEVPGQTGEALTDFAVYGSCWVLGFAHHDRFFHARLPRYVVPSVAPLLMGAGLWWASGHLGPDGWDLNDIPLAQALWSFGFCALLLQVSPSWERLPGPLQRFDGAITLANARAMTLYLWHEAALLAVVPLLDLAWEIPLIGDSPTLSDGLETTYMFWMFVFVWPLILLAVLAFGWIEDLAARRRPRLLPIRS
ncbi:acyltransferase family protein [Streptomyces xiaopingdaonensis]|uniref:acyltransferase family protein n=1 Tax=Streptomyces xiaopingdaonensis TaxID=1565415 RepID=UPI0002F18347|nr:acyltransferase [Streptomyces xiaopingdaonensis]